MVRYVPKHDWVKRYVPKEFQEIADSLVDHIGDLVTTKPGNCVGAILGFNFGLEIGQEDPKKLALYACTGWLAFDALNNPNPITSIVGLTTLGVFGTTFIFGADIKAQIQTTQKAFQGAVDVNKYPMTAEERAKLDSLKIALASAMLGTVGDLTEAQNALNEYTAKLKSKYGEE